MKRAGLLAALLLAACVDQTPPVRAPRPADPRPAPAAAPPVQRPPWQARRVVADAIDTPQGRIHTVKPGETGIAIARAYGVEWAKIIAINHLKAPFTLEVGDRLLLPSKRAVAAMSVEDRAKAFKLDIDDLITGSEPAAGGKLVAAAPPAKRGTAATRPARPSGPTAAPTPTPVQPAAAPLPDLGEGQPRFVWPVEGRVLSGFGAKPGGRFNDGVNLKTAAGSTVRAAADGVVAYAGDAIPGFGNLLLIKHAGGWVTAYAHNEALLVARGTRVRQGEPVARAGATGAVTEPQVHFEVRRGRTPVDPATLVGR